MHNCSLIISIETLLFCQVSTLQFLVLSCYGYNPTWSSPISASPVQGSMSCVFRECTICQMQFQITLLTLMFRQTLPDLSTLSMCFIHLLHSQFRHFAQAGCLKKVLYLLKWVTESVCFAWRGLEVLIPACDHHDSVLTLCSSFSHLCLIPRLPLSILCYTKSP